MDSETHREDGHGKTEAEIGMRRLQAKECQGLPTGAGKSKERFSPRTFRKDAALLTTCCPTCNLQNRERKHFCIITPPTLWCSINGSLRKLDSVQSIEIFNGNFKKQICSEILIQYIWGEACDSAFLTCSHVMLMLLVQPLHFQYHYCRI